MATQTPWGKSQDKRTITRGINFYTTASHGGYKVSKKMNEQIPRYLRLDDGWYEEDCHWAHVVIAFPQHFSEDEYKAAYANLKEWNWRAFEIHFNFALQPGESSKKDREMFEFENRDNQIAVAAFGDWHEKVPAGMVGVVVGTPSKKFEDEQTILVPQNEYDLRKNTHGIFVVQKEYESVSI